MPIVLSARNPLDGWTKGPVPLIMSECQPAGTRHSRHWFQFSLRTAFIVVTVLAFAFSWIRTEMVGKLVRESDTGGTISFFRSARTGCGTGLPESLSVDELTVRVITILDRDVPNHPFKQEDFRFYNEQRDIYGRTISYDFNKWVRRRLDIRALKYVFDVHDPVARFRNGQVHKAITDAVNMDRVREGDSPQVILRSPLGVYESSTCSDCPASSVTC